MVYFCAVAILFLLPSQDHLHAELQERDLFNGHECTPEFRDAVWDYFEDLGKGVSHTTVYHTPWSIVDCVSRYVLYDIKLRSYDSVVAHNQYERFRSDQFLPIMNISYVTRSSRGFSNDWPSSTHLRIRPNDVLALQTSEDCLYDLFKGDLLMLSKIMDRSQSCCGKSHAILYGCFRYPVALDRLQSIIALLEWMIRQYAEIPISAISAEILQLIPACSAATMIKVARFADHAFEELLAWAYSIDLMQPFEHRNGRITCMTSYLRSTGKDYEGLWPPQWYRDLPLKGLEYLNMKDIASAAYKFIEEIEFAVSVDNNHAMYRSHIQEWIIKISFLREQDLPRERQWQRILEYLTIISHDLRIHNEHYRSTLPFYDQLPSYYPSPTVRDNHIIPTIYHPIQQYQLTLGMHPPPIPHDSKANDEPYNPWQLMHVPSSIRATLNDNSTLYQMGMHVVSTVTNLQLPPAQDATFNTVRNPLESIDSFNPYQGIEYSPSEDIQRNVWLLLNDLLLHYAIHEIHPQYLIVDLVRGSFLTKEQSKTWHGYGSRHRNRKLGIGGHAYVSSSFIRHCETPQMQPLSNDKYISHYYIAIHQLICDYILVFYGNVTQSAISSEYDSIAFDHTAVTQHNIFAGFRFRRLHAQLLRYWFHTGALTVEGAVDELCYGLKHRVQLTLTSDRDETYHRWVKWAVDVMTIVDTLIKTMRANIIFDYTVEDSNRVSLLVWEKALQFMDALIGNEVPDMERLSEDLAHVYLRYSTTLSYPSVCSADVIVASTMEWDHEDQDNEFVQLAMFPPTSLLSMKQTQAPSQTQQTQAPCQPLSSSATDSQYMMFVAMQQQWSQQLDRMREELDSLKVSLKDKDQIISVKEQEINRLSRASSSSSSVAIAVPIQTEYQHIKSTADQQEHADRYAKAQAQEAHIQIINNGPSQSMYPVRPVFPSQPLVAAVVVPSMPSTSSTSSLPRRIVPSSVVTNGDIRIHFPSAIHAYFTTEGEYNPDWPIFVSDYLNRFIYKTCYQSSRIVNLPEITPSFIVELQKWQVEQLVRHRISNMTKCLYVLPDVIMELFCLYMDERFCVMPSTIPDAGNGLFVKTHITISEDFYLPYSGYLITDLTDLDKGDDKIMALRDGIYVKGSEIYIFEVTGHRYSNLMAMCNERLAQDMVYANNGEFTNSGLVRMRRLSSFDQPHEITLIYAALPMTVAELQLDIRYRENVRRSILHSLWVVLDNILVQLSLSWYMLMRTSLLHIFDEYTSGAKDLNSLRGQKTVIEDSVVRFIHRCLSVVDGTFISSFKSNPVLNIFPLLQSGQSVPMNMTEQVIPDMLLLHMYSVYFLGHYKDAELRRKIQSHDVNNYVLMGKIMKDLGVLITSSTKMTRLVRNSNYVGASTFQYLQFSIKYGDNMLLSMLDDNDDHAPPSSRTTTLPQPPVSLHVDPILHVAPSTPITTDSSMSSVKASLFRPEGNGSRVSLTTGYNISTLPNTKEEACIWNCTSVLSYDKYLSVEGGRLQNHPMVKNNFVSNNNSTLYNTIMTLMMLNTPYTVQSSYYRVDSHKKDISLDNRIKIPEFGKLYQITQCLYEHTILLLSHYSQAGIPYYYLYIVLVKGNDLDGEAKIKWESQLASAALSLVDDDIIHMILRSQTVQHYQMRDIVELIIDLIVYRVLLFGKLKNKSSVRAELQSKRLVSSTPGTHLDGIYALVLHALHYSKVFIGDDYAVQDLVDILVHNVSSTSVHHLQLGSDFRTNLTQVITQYSLTNKDKLASMSVKDSTLSIFGCIERFARNLQDNVLISLPRQSDRALDFTIKSPTVPVSSSTYRSNTSSPYRRPMPSSSSYSHNTTRHKPTSIHSVTIQEDQDDSNAGHLYVKSRMTPINEWPNLCFELEEHHVLGKHTDMKNLMHQMDHSILPINCALLSSSELHGTPTIHVRMFQILSEVEGEKRLIDTKCTIENTPFQGTCNLCGYPRHDANHCRFRGYNTGPNGEQLLNLATYVYFDDVKLEEALNYAKKDGFLKSATEEEIKWVRTKISELREHKKMLYRQNVNRFQRPNSPGIYGPASSSS